MSELLLLQDAACLYDSGSQPDLVTLDNGQTYQEYFGEFYTTGLLLCVPLNCSLDDVSSQYSNPQLAQSQVVADGATAIAYDFVYWLW